MLYVGFQITLLFLEKWKKLFQMLVEIRTSVNSHKPASDLLPTSDIQHCDTMHECQELEQSLKMDPNMQEQLVNIYSFDFVVNFKFQNTLLCFFYL